jgi:hypothetical protein
MQDIKPVLAGIVNTARVAKFRKKIRTIKKKAARRFVPIDSGIERKHKEYWKQLMRAVDPLWLRFYTNMSGIPDIHYVPEDIFYAVIERRLNDINYSWLYADKNFYDVRFGDTVFPKTLLKNMSGTFVDAENRAITKAQGLDILKDNTQDFVIKPSLNSGRGRRVERIDVETTNDYDALLASYGESYIIQEVLTQAPFFRQFSKRSVNTLRVFLYRSVVSERIYPVKCVLRMGRGDRFVDNGGVSCGVNEKGKLNSYGCTLYGDKYESHPDTDVIFDGQEVPCFDKIIREISELAQKIPTQRLLSFDVVLDVSGSVRVVEINTCGVEINFLQFFGGGLFGRNTDEIVDYCATARDKFDYFRITK